MTRKNQYLAIRLTSDLKDKIEKFAKFHRWTKSVAVCEILTDFLDKYELSGDYR